MKGRMTMTEQEKLDRQNPAWRPEWKRKQPRTSKNLSEVQEPTKEDAVNEDVLKLVPQAAKENKPLSMADFSKLLEALEYYAANNQFSISVSEFVLRFTKLEPNYIHAYMSNHKESNDFKQWERLYTRARGILEANITKSHVHNNPQFAQFYLNNKFGYASKPEGGNTTNIAINARSFLQQIGRLPEQEAERERKKAIEAKATNEPAKLPAGTLPSVSKT